MPITLKTTEYMRQAASSIASAAMLAAMNIAFRSIAPRILVLFIGSMAVLLLFHCAAALQLYAHFEAALATPGETPGKLSNLQTQALSEAAKPAIKTLLGIRSDIIAASTWETIMPDVLEKIEASAPGAVIDLNALLKASVKQAAQS